MAVNKQDLNRLLKQAVIHLTGASMAGIKAELYDVLHEFFYDSSCWIDAVPFGALYGVHDYSLTVPYGMITRLAGVIDNNCRPVPAIMPSLGTIHLRDVPNTSTAPLDFQAFFVLDVQLPTSRDGVPNFPDWVLPLHGPGVLDGLLGRMMMQQNKSYSNQTLGLYHLRRFRDAISRARTAAIKRNTFGAQSWRFPQSFSTPHYQGVAVGPDHSF